MNKPLKHNWWRLGDSPCPGIAMQLKQNLPTRISSAACRNLPVRPVSAMVQVGCSSLSSPVLPRLAPAIIMGSSTLLPLGVSLHPFPLPWCSTVHMWPKLKSHHVTFCSRGHTYAQIKADIPSVAQSILCNQCPDLF